MAIVTVISVGTLKEDYLKDAIAEYKKRLSQYTRVEEVNIKEEKICDEDNQKEITRALDSEGERILASIPQGSTKIALCVEGNAYSSEALAELDAVHIDPHHPPLAAGSYPPLCLKCQKGVIRFRHNPC